MFPVEIWTLIFTYSLISDYESLSEVCRMFYELLEDIRHRAKYVYNVNLRFKNQVLKIKNINSIIAIANNMPYEIKNESSCTKLTFKKYSRNINDKIISHFRSGQGVPDIVLKKYNCTSNDYIQLPQFITKLELLKIDPNYDIIDIFPCNLTHLTVNNIGSNFLKFIPDTVTHLTIYNYCDTVLSGFSPTNKIYCLTLGGIFETNIFELPSKLFKLAIVDDYYVNIVCDFPKSLMSLTLNLINSKFIKTNYVDKALKSKIKYLKTKYMSFNLLVQLKYLTFLECDIILDHEYTLDEYKLGSLLLIKGLKINDLQTNNGYYVNGLFSVEYVKYNIGNFLFVLVNMLKCLELLILPPNSHKFINRDLINLFAERKITCITE